MPPTSISRYSKSSLSANVLRLQFRTEYFNLTNTPTFFLGSGSSSALTCTGTPGGPCTNKVFGTLANGNATGRQGQFGLELAILIASPMQNPGARGRRATVILLLAGCSLGQVAKRPNEDYATAERRRHAASEMSHWVRPRAEQTVRLVDSLGIRSAASRRPSS